MARGVVRAKVGGLGFLAHAPRIYLSAGIDSQVLTPPARGAAAVLRLRDGHVARQRAAA
jgi:hypothetical protein